jgi:hypothetical protein
MRSNGPIFAVLSLIVLIIIEGSPAFGENIDWEDRFIQADFAGKYEVINQAIAADNIPLKFLSDLINTDKYRDQFPTYCVFRNFQLAAASKISSIPTKGIIELLRRFYYGGAKSRIFNRPREFSFSANWQRPVCETTDSGGVRWALINIPWYGCGNDLWLARKKVDGEAWDDPLFTGYQSKTLPKILPDGNYPEDNSGFHLTIEDDGIYIVSADGSVNDRISPAALTIDTDKDGFYDIEEERFGTDPSDEDTDNDGLVDGIDINPLTIEKRELQPEDYAKMAVLMWQTARGQPIDVYFVNISEIDSLEFLIPSPNALVLPLNSTGLVSNDCDCRSWGVFGQKTSIGISLIDEATISASLSYGSSTTNYIVRRIREVWVVTDQLGTIEY